MNRCGVCSTEYSSKEAMIPDYNIKFNGFLHYWVPMCATCASRFEGDYYVKDI